MYLIKLIYESSVRVRTFRSRYRNEEATKNKKAPQELKQRMEQMEKAIIASLLVMTTFMSAQAKQGTFAKVTAISLGSQR